MSHPVRRFESSAGILEQVAITLFAVLQFALGLPSFHKLPDLASYIRHHFEKVVIGLLDRVAEEFHYTKHFSAENYGKTKGGVESIAGGNFSSWKVIFARKISDVLNPV